MVLSHSIQDSLFILDAKVVLDGGLTGIPLRVYNFVDVRLFLCDGESGRKCFGEGRKEFQPSEDIVADKILCVVIHRRMQCRV